MWIIISLYLFFNFGAIHAIFSQSNAKFDMKPTTSPIQSTSRAGLFHGPMKPTETWIKCNFRAFSLFHGPTKVRIKCTPKLSQKIGFSKTNTRTKFEVVWINITEVIRILVFLVNPIYVTKYSKSNKKSSTKYLFMRVFLNDSYW